MIEDFKKQKEQIARDLEEYCKPEEVVCETELFETEILHLLAPLVEALKVNNFNFFFTIQVVDGQTKEGDEITGFVDRLGVGEGKLVCERLQLLGMIKALGVEQFKRSMEQEVIKNILDQKNEAEKEKGKKPEVNDDHLVN